MKYLAMLTVVLMASTMAHAQMNVRVRGNGVDIDNVGSSGYKLMYPIGTRTGWEANYYLPGQYHLFNVRPAAIVNKDFATTGKSPGDSRTDYSMDSFSADAAGTVTIAVPSGSLNAPGWTSTSTSFSSSISTFYLYTYNYTTPGTWVTIPSASSSVLTILFAEKGHLKFDNPLPLSELAEGVMVAYSYDDYNRGDYTTDPDLIVLPNGDYIAGEYGHRHISKDKGLNWARLEQNGYGLKHASTFYYGGALYIIGDISGPGGISKSTDGGKTWSGPVRLIDNFRNSPSHVEVAQGRIWIAYENLPAPHTVNFLSAATTSDLMNASSWVTTTRTDTTGTGNETDMVLGRDGWPIAMPKNGGPPVRAISSTQATASSADAFTLPVSGSKYTAKYDPVSDKWWALTSYSPIAGNVRTGIGLFSSTDLKTFKLERQVIQGKSTAFHGFNYPSMQIDGDDIVFVSRTAWENDMGQAQRWHDADMLTFHRIRNFRGFVPIGEFVNPGFEEGMTGWLTEGDTNANYVQTVNPHSGTNNLAHYKTSAYQVNTFQLVTEPNGIYTASAWVKCSGGQSQCYFYVSGYGGAEIRTNILASPTTYTKVTITNINVTSGFCRIGVYSDASVGKWVTVDDVELFAPPVPPAVWTNSGGGSWATSGNWTNNLIPNAANVQVDFSQLTLTGDRVVTLDGAKTAGPLVFGDGAGLYNWTLTEGTGGPLTLADANPPAITVNSGNTTIGAVLAGTDGMVKAGDGTLSLMAKNTYNGDTMVNSGLLALSVPNDGQGALAWSGSLTINAGATVRMDNNNSLIGYNAPVGSLPVTINTGGTLTCLGTAQSGAGADGHIRGLLILQGGTLTTDGTGINTKFGTWDLDAGVLVDGETDTSVIACRYAIPSQAGGTRFNVADGGTASGVDLLVSGTLDDATSYHDTGIIKLGEGTMLLAGTNTYARPTIISEGTLLVNGSLAAGSVVTVQSNGTLGGTGRIGGPVTFNAGSFAQLTLGSPLTLTNTLTVATGGALPVVKVKLTNNVLPGSYTLATYKAAGSSGAFAGTPEIVSGSLIAGATSTITTGGGLVSMVVTPPPSVPGFPADAIEVSGGTVSLTATGALGSTYKLWASTNMRLAPIESTWTLLANGTITGSPFIIADPGAVTNQQRFYLFSAP